jgi:hypothetical protein
MQVHRSGVVNLAAIAKLEPWTYGDGILVIDVGSWSASSAHSGARRGRPYVPQFFWDTPREPRPSLRSAQRPASHAPATSWSG